MTSAELAQAEVLKKRGGPYSPEEGEFLAKVEDSLRNEAKLTELAEAQARWAERCEKEGVKEITDDATLKRCGKLEAIRKQLESMKVEREKLDDGIDSFEIMIEGFLAKLPKGVRRVGNRWVADK